MGYYHRAVGLLIGHCCEKPVKKILQPAGHSFNSSSGPTDLHRIGYALDMYTVLNGDRKSPALLVSAKNRTPGGELERLPN